MNSPGAYPKSEIELNISFEAPRMSNFQIHFANVFDFVSPLDPKSCVFFIPKPQLRTEFKRGFLHELQPLKGNKASSGTASLAAMKPVQDRARLVKGYVLVLVPARMKACKYN